MLSLDVQAIWENRQGTLPAHAADTIRAVLQALHTGEVCVVEKQEGVWCVNEWVKQAILLAFASLPLHMMPGHAFDRIPLQFRDYTAEDFLRDRVRVTPGAVIREGVYLGQQSVVMMSFLNAGVHIGAHSMIDTMSTVGSCAYLGDHVHVGAQTTIGGVIEPLQAHPVIIEDRVFIGAGCQILEGVLVGEGAILASGVHLTQSTKIYDTRDGRISYGQIPPGAVVIPGSLPRDQGQYALSCAVITKVVDASLRQKLSINELLRQH